MADTDSKKTVPAQAEGSKGGRPRASFDVAAVEQAAMWCDNEREIALALGISRTTLWRRKGDDEAFSAAIERGRAKANVFVGGKLMELIKKGNVAATIFYMKARCHWSDSDNAVQAGQPVSLVVMHDLKPDDKPKADN